MEDIEKMGERVSKLREEFGDDYVKNAHELAGEFKIPTEYAESIAKFSEVKILDFWNIALVEIVKIIILHTRFGMGIFFPYDF